MGLGGAASQTAAMGKGRAPKGNVAKTAMKKAKAKAAKVEKVQKAKAKAHAMKKVLKKPMATPGPEIVAMEEGEEEEHQDVDTEEEGEGTKPKAKGYYQPNSKLAKAPCSCAGCNEQDQGKATSQWQAGQVGANGSGLCQIWMERQIVQEHGVHGALQGTTEAVQGIPQAGHGHKAWWRRWL